MVSWPFDWGKPEGSVRWHLDAFSPGSTAVGNSILLDDYGSRPIYKGLFAAQGQEKDGTGLGRPFEALSPTPPICFR